MPMTPKELAELSTLIAAARKKPINYGLCIGKKPDSTILYLHRKKSPEILMRLAKKAGDTAKVAMGTVSVSGKKMIFSVMGDAPSGMDKRVKLFLTANKTPFVVEVLEESGEDGGAASAPVSGEGALAASPAPQPPSAEEIAAYKETYATAKKRLKQLRRLKVNLSALKADLAAAAKLAKDEKISEAMLLLSGMAPKFTAAEQAYCDRMKIQAREKIDLAAAHIGAGLEIPKLEAMFKALEVECANAPIDRKKIRAIVKGISRREKQLRRAGRKFKKEYEAVKAYTKKFCEDVLADIAHDLQPTEKDGFEKDIVAIHKKLDEHSAKLAQKMAVTLFMRIFDVKDLLQEAKDYEIFRRAVEAKLTTLYANRANGIEEDCVRLEAEEIKAEGFEKDRKFYDASLIMKAIDAEIVSLQGLARDYKFYLVSLRQLQAQLTIVKRNPQYEFIVPEFTALIVGLKAAIALADKKELGKATNKIIDLMADAKALEVKASKAAPLTDFENAIDSGDIDDLRQQAKDILSDLQRHPRAKQAPLLLADVAKHVDQLDSIWNQLIESAARDEMKTISSLANETRIKLDAVDVFLKRADTLAVNTTQFGKTHAQALYIRPFLVKIALIVTLAKNSALASEAGIAKDLSEGERLLALAKTTADAEEAYRTHRAITEPSVTALSDAAVVFDGKAKTLADIKTQMDAAEASSKAFKHEGAEKALDTADTLVMTGNIGASAKLGTPPDKADIQKLLDQPDGEKALDGLVALLPDSTQQDVMINVLEVRFGMEVNVYASVSKEDDDKEKKGRSLDVPAPKLLAYYEALKTVPASHTNLNPSLERFDSVEEDKGGFYSSGDKRAVIQLDNLAEKEMGKRIGNPNELDNIDADSVARPAADAGAKEPTLASWVTYHEIGHAVDDRLSFMDGKANNADFGGWIEYGGNIGPIAKAVAAHFEYDPSYVERTMAGGKPKTPKVPSDLRKKEGAKANEIWAKRKKSFKLWRKAVSTKSKPWKKASAVSAHKINDVMYQEAYSGSWVSYIADARKKGVTGYQFRAPGEWFAELYAAYHSKKLNTSHHANTWLAGL